MARKYNKHCTKFAACSSGCFGAFICVLFPFITELTTLNFTLTSLTHSQMTRSHRFPRPWAPTITSFRRICLRAERGRVPLSSSSNNSSTLATRWAVFPARPASPGAPGSSRRKSRPSKGPRLSIHSRLKVEAVVAVATADLPFRTSSTALRTALARPVGQSGAN